MDVCHIIVVWNTITVESDMKKMSARYVHRMLTDAYTDRSQQTVAVATFLQDLLLWTNFGRFLVGYRDQNIWPKIFFGQWCALWWKSTVCRDWKILFPRSSLEIPEHLYENVLTTKYLLNSYDKYVKVCLWKLFKRNYFFKMTFSQEAQEYLYSS